MKSILNCICKKSSKPFPKLMKSKTSGVIVLFESSCKGVIVNGENSAGDTIGFYNNSWQMGSFADYDGTVTLSND